MGHSPLIPHTQESNPVTQLPGFFLCTHWENLAKGREGQLTARPANTVQQPEDKGIRRRGRLLFQQTRAECLPRWKSPWLEISQFASSFLRPSFPMTKASQAGVPSCLRYWCHPNGSSRAPGKRGRQCASCGKQRFLEKSAYTGAPAQRTEIPGWSGATTPGV